MYSYEISQYLEARNYYFESFYEFENSLRSKSPQVRYDIIDEKPDCKVIHMDDTMDNHPIITLHTKWLPQILNVDNICLLNYLYCL